MFKFIHAADIHLDSPLRGLSRYESAPVESIRNASRRAFENLVEFAITEKVGFYLQNAYVKDWVDNTMVFVEVSDVDAHYQQLLALDLPALYAFICGRGAQEKTIAELKGEFALDVVPTHHYGANSAWQQLSVLAHNLARSFQLDTLATPKPRSRKRTYAYLIRSMRTLRFLLIARAGRLTRIGGRHVLRLSHNPATEALYASVTQRLAA